MRCIAFTGQRYKIWKQITTFNLINVSLIALLLLVKDTKFESKSQLWSATTTHNLNCFYWSKIQNLKANHNLSSQFLRWRHIAFTGQRYKIWKQITTNSLASSMRSKLLLLVKDTKFESKSQQNTLVGKFIEHCFYWSKIQNLLSTWQKFEHIEFRLVERS